MATNRFFDNVGLSVVDGQIAKASQLNSVTSETNKGFDLVEAELNAISVGALLSQQWADNDQGDPPDSTNHPGKYSSRANAEEAEGWTVGPVGTATEADGVTLITHSAKDEADKALDAAQRAEDAADSTGDDVALAQEWAEKPYGQQITGYPGSYSSLHHSQDSLQSKNAAETAAGESEAARDESETARDWSNAWAQEAEDVPVNDGVNPSGFSAYHWAEKAKDNAGAVGVLSIVGLDPIVADNVTDPSNPIVSWAGDKTDVGLGNVDNTSDLNKPISNATQVALDTIEALANSKVASVSGGTDITITGTATDPIVNYSGTPIATIAWGAITGTLSDQTDLQAALDAKEDFLGTPASDGYILQSNVAGNVRSWRPPPVESKMPAGGLTDEVLAKNSDTDYDLKWTPQTGGGGGAGGLEWVTPEDGQLVEDPGFDDPPYWSVTAGAIVSGSKGSSDGSLTDMYIFKGGLVANGKTYMVELDIESNDGIVRIVGYNGSTYQDFVVSTSAQTGKLQGSFTPTVQDASEFFLIRFDNGTTAVVDNVTLYEVGAALPDVTAEAGKGYPLYGNQTLVLPASPAQNDQVGWKDYENAFGTNAAYIDPNGNPIENLGNGIMALNTRGQGGQLTWIEDRWSITNVTELTAGGTVANKPFMHVEDHKPVGTAGGTSAAGFNDRDLNTVIANDIPGASLSNNEITLPAGEYYIEALSPYRQDFGFTRAYIRDTLDNEILRGSNWFHGYGGSPMVNGRITLAEPTVIKLTHWGNGALATEGLGAAASEGSAEIYGSIRIWKLDTEIKTITVDDPEQYLKKPLLLAEHREPLGETGGATTVGINTRPLNTLVVNEIAGASLANNFVTLPAGEYWIEGSSSAISMGNPYKLMLRRVSDEVTLLDGWGGGTANIDQNITLNGRLVLTEETQVKLVFNTGTANSAGLGYFRNLGNHELYGSLKVWAESQVVQSPKVYHQPVQPIAGAYVTGNIFGGELEYVDNTTFNVKPVSCMSDDLTVPLAIDATTLVDLGTPVLNTVYNAFIVKETGGAISIMTDTDVDGANLVGITHKRWLGFVRADASGAIQPFWQEGDTYDYTTSPVYYPSNNTATRRLTRQPDWMPAERIASVTVGTVARASYGYGSINQDHQGTAAPASIAGNASDNPYGNSADIVTEYFWGQGDDGYGIKLFRVTHKR